MSAEWPGLPLPHAPANRPRLSLLLVPIGVLVVMANVGTIFAAALLNRSPALLLALDARNRHLLLVVGAGIGAVPFFLIGFLRLLAADPPFYLLGYWYGDRGLRWLEEKSGGVPAYVRWIEKGFDKAKYPLVLLMPNNIVCMMAGIRKMPMKVFFTLNIIGTIGRLCLFWFLGVAFRQPLETIIDWITRYQWWVVGGFFVLALVQGGRRAAQQEREREEHPADDDLPAAGEPDVPPPPPTH